MKKELNTKIKIAFWVYLLLVTIIIITILETPLGFNTFLYLLIMLFLSVAIYGFMQQHFRHCFDNFYEAIKLEMVLDLLKYHEVTRETIHKFKEFQYLQKKYKNFLKCDEISELQRNNLAKIISQNS